MPVNWRLELYKLPQTPSAGTSLSIQLALSCCPRAMGTQVELAAARRHPHRQRRFLPGSGVDRCPANNPAHFDPLTVLLAVSQGTEWKNLCLGKRTGPITRSVRSHPCGYFPE